MDDLHLYNKNIIKGIFWLQHKSAVRTCPITEKITAKKKGWMRKWN